MPDSPLKKIFLPFVLDRQELNRDDPDTDPLWHDKSDQLVHVEPMAGGTFCAVVMMNDGRNADGEYQLRIDVRFESEPEWRVNPDPDKTKLEPTISTNIEYDYDLYVDVIPRLAGQTTSFELGWHKLQANQFIDLHFTEAYLGTVKDKSELALASSRRICKIRVF